MSDILFEFADNGPWTEGCPETSTEWKWATKDGQLWIAFRGSTSAQDWRQNFTIFPKKVLPYKNMAVKWYAHKGFLDKWQSVQKDVLALVRGKNPVRVVVMGFSQGGAVAVLAYEDILFKCSLPVGCHTWGAPAAVFGYNWKKIKQRWEGSVLHRQFAEDIVPKSTCLFGYRHGGASVKRWCGIKPFPWNWKKIHMNYWDWKE